MLRIVIPWNFPWSSEVPISRKGKERDSFQVYQVQLEGQEKEGLFPMPS